MHDLCLKIYEQKKIFDNLICNMSNKLFRVILFQNVEFVIKRIKKNH